MEEVMEVEPVRDQVNPVLPEVKIVKHGDLDLEDENSHILMGGDNSNPTWKVYIIGYKEEWRPRFEAIKKLIEDEHLVGVSGQMQDNWHFEFDDGLKIGFTWRAWGDLMQAIVGKREGYMAYYM